VAVAVLDMVICLVHALNALVDIIQQVQPTLVNHAVLANGPMQEIAFVKIVSRLLDAKHALQQALVALVSLDMKVITLEDAEYVMKEHILQPVDLVFLALMVNGRYLVAISVKNVLKLMDVMLARRLPLVKLVLLDIRQMDLEAAVHAVLDFSPNQTATLVSSVLMENIPISHQVLVHPVMVMALAAALALQ